MLGKRQPPSKRQSEERRSVSTPGIAPGTTQMTKPSTHSDMPMRAEWALLTYRERVALAEPNSTNTSLESIPRPLLLAA